MSCLSAIGSQLLTFVSVPHEILSLQHKVFQEYARVALGPDFSHTFPSFILLAAICVILRRNLRLQWRPIRKLAPLWSILKVIVSWIIVNAVLWYWLLFQQMIYCFVWTYWTKDFAIPEIYFPWWQKVWSSFYPPSSGPPMLSASLISWWLSMFLTGGTLYCAIYSEKLRSSISKISLTMKESIKTLKIPNLRRRQKMTSKNALETQDTTDRSEMESYCDECRSEVSASIETDVILIKREISPISYGTNWTPRPEFNLKKPQRDISCRTVAGVIKCKEPSEDNWLPRLRNRRNCHTVMPSSSSERSTG